MIYDCKIVIKEDRWNDNFFFDIYIKYKPQNSIGLYKKYFILNEYLRNKGIQEQVEDLLNNSHSRIEKLRWFNNLSTEDIKQMVSKYVKEQQKEKSEDEIKEEEFQKQLNLAKAKANKFTVEV